MKRVTILAISLLTLGASVAFADTAMPTSPEGAFQAMPQPPQGPSVPQPDDRTIHAFQGEIVSVDAGAGTVEADAEYLGTPQDPVHVPVIQRMTFRAGPETHVALDAKQSSLEALKAGDLLHVAIVASRDASLDEVLATPAWVVSAYRVPGFYGFGGRVIDVDPEAGEITLKVRYTTPDARRVLDQHGSDRVTLTTDSETEVWVEGEPSSLDELGPGDLAGVGILAGRRASADEVLSTPARVVFGLAEERKASRGQYRTLARKAARAARKRR